MNPSKIRGERQCDDPRGVYSIDHHESRVVHSACVFEGEPTIGPKSSQLGSVGCQLDAHPTPSTHRREWRSCCSSTTGSSSPSAAASDWTTGKLSDWALLAVASAWLFSCLWHYWSRGSLTGLPWSLVMLRPLCFPMPPRDCLGIAWRRHFRVALLQWASPGCSNVRRTFLTSTTSTLLSPFFALGLFAGIAAIASPSTPRRHALADVPQQRQGDAYKRSSPPARARRRT